MTTFAADLWSRFRKARPTGGGRGPARRRVLVVEPLEDRALPSAVATLPDPPAPPPAEFGELYPPRRPVVLAVADLNQDGQDDVVLGDGTGPGVTVHLDGKPPALDRASAEPAIDPRAVRLADLNGDGHPDLVVADAAGNRVLVHPGLGAGAFGPAGEFPTGDGPG